MKEMCIKAIAIAEKFYPAEKLQHALRVAKYAVEMGNLDVRCGDKSDELFVVGLLHDIIEDTNYTKEQLYNDFRYPIGDPVMILTKDKNEDYEDYIYDILNSKDIIAFLVKKADMKDHMTQLKTLNNKLKEKYIPVIQYFI